MINPAKSLSQLKNDYAAMQVAFEDDFTLQRAIIYLEIIQEVYKIFSSEEFINELGGAKSEAYNKIQPVFAGKDLLVGLCQILDSYIIEPVNNALQANKISYGQYFNDMLTNYPNSVKEFYNNYPRSARAFQNAVKNFKNNILTACKRILSDWGPLQTMFGGTRQLKQLVRLQSTGSDFHKGGQQVLILTFRLDRENTFLNIIYKPSDLEIDCLIIGDTAALKNIGLNLGTPSLMEILNSYQPPFTFPTYKILPRNLGSSLQRESTGQLPIRRSYGYIEFLEYDGILGTPSNLMSLCENFYSQLGQITAIACAFSLTDLHMQNLIVHQHMPYLIDLETALIRPVTAVTDTALVGLATAIDGGAIKGILSETKKPYVAKATSTKIQVWDTYHPEKNRLWTIPGQIVEAETYLKYLYFGFTQTCVFITKIQNEEILRQWRLRLNGAIIRVIPVGSDALATIVLRTFSADQPQALIETVAKGEIAKQLNYSYSDWVKHNSLKSNEVTWQTYPLFLCLQEEYMLEDILNCDVPVFYHKLGTREVMDSNGKTIVNKQFKNLQILWPHETFFPEDPLHFTLDIQLKSFTPDRIADLVKEVENIMGPLKDQQACDDALEASQSQKKLFDRK